MNNNTGLPILRPMPRRAFEITPASTEPPSPPSPASETADSLFLDPNSKRDHSRTRSILNLTSSTLFGIYSPTDSDGNPEDINTPWGTGALTPQMPRTPANGKSVDDKRPPVIGPYERRPFPATRQLYSHSTFRERWGHVVARTLLLYLFGVAYGLIVAHLHNEQHLAPVKVEGIEGNSWIYVVSWGFAGVCLGSLLPWVDIIWEDTLGNQHHDQQSESVSTEKRKDIRTISEDMEVPSSRGENGLGADWNPIVRSVGAFVGIAFAIRRLPWQSTLQVSLTLALVNPVLWYIIDRSKAGFVLSTILGIGGTAVLLGVNPEIVPHPAISSPPANAMNSSNENSMVLDQMITNESIGVATWIASVIFCSCVCFGNVGRRLAVEKTGTRKSGS